MNPPKVMFAVTNDLTYDRRMARICRTLAAGGFEVILIGRKRKHSVPFHPGSFKGVRLHCFFDKGPGFYAEFNLKLTWYLLTHRATILCACDLDTALPVRFAGWFTRTKTVYDAHEYFTEVPELTGRPFVKRIWEWIGRWCIPAFDVRYTVGSELAVLMSSRYKVPFEVIRNIEPAPAVRADTIYPPKSKVLLYQGAINVGRGLEACIEAMTQLSGWEFWLAGEGDITDILKRKVKEMGLEARVKFLGWVKPEDLPALMQKATLAINLREKGSLNDYYSLPNKFFDAIHAGLPAIHMNYPEYATIVRQFPCARLIENVAVQEIVETIKDLESHPEKVTAMAQACRDAARELTWEKEAEKLLELYTRLKD